MADQSDVLIDDRYAVLATQPVPGAGGGLPCFAARDRQTGDASLIALQVRRDAPARVHALQMLAVRTDTMLNPLAHGPAAGPRGEPGYFVICPAPPGPPLSERLRPWPEAAIVAFALRPIALALERLATFSLTHRGIRLTNVFEGPRGQALVLGAAWAAPAAMHQPAVFEPPYSAMCHPSGRGDGSIADDVYSLGVLLLTLALGRPLMPDMDDATILRRKLELGSHAALVGDERLPPLIGDLLRGMLAEDPDHRPTPTLLLDPGVARSRRVAARPPHRAQRALPIGNVVAWDSRTLAYAMTVEADQGIAALRSGAVLQWVRRGLGDAAIAARVEDVVRARMPDAPTEEPRTDAVTLMGAVAALDPLAPLCWRGTTFWPDGLGPLLAAEVTNPAVSSHLSEMVASEAPASWAALRPERVDLAITRLEARQNRAWLTTRGPAGGLPRLTYLLNPLLPCASPVLAEHWISRLADLPAALESAASANTKAVLLDPHIAAFIAARGDSRIETDTNGLTISARATANLPELRLLAQLQLRYHPRPLPATAAWVAAASGAMVALWCNRARRRELADRLKALAATGMLIPMLALLEDPPGRTADAEGARQAAAELNRIDAELRTITAGAAQRGAAASRIGQEIASGVALAALAAMLAMAVLG